MKVTLRINGRERTFTEEELISIIEKHVETETKKFFTMGKTVEIPGEGKWFKVIPLTINKNLFSSKRFDSNQEKTRQVILAAFEEMGKNPEYTRPFVTMFPEKKWLCKTPLELKEMANKLGDHNANWVEQALEWAMRISNGESWETICNHDDRASCHRLVEWTDGHWHRVGGARMDSFLIPPSGVFNGHDEDDERLYFTVPLVVNYVEE